MLAEVEGFLLQLKEVNSDTFGDIPEQCRTCLYWLAGEQTHKSAPRSDMERQKREWLVKVAETTKNHGYVAYLDGAPLGFIHFATSSSLPRTGNYRSGPPSRDAAFLACFHISSKDQRRNGWGTMMLNNLKVELKKTGVKAIETFARRHSENNPSGPLEFYMKNGFQIVRDLDDFPLVRLHLEPASRS